MSARPSPSNGGSYIRDAVTGELKTEGQAYRDAQPKRRIFRLIEPRVLEPHEGLPCPWCGVQPTIERRSSDWLEQNAPVLISCENYRCAARPQIEHEGTLPAALRRWNNRKGNPKP